MTSSNTCKEHFTSIYECKTTDGSRWNSEMRVAQNGRIPPLVFPGRARDRRLSPSRSSVTLPLQYSHRFFALVVSCLASTAIYGELLAGMGTPVPNLGWWGVLPGSYSGIVGCVSLDALPRTPWSQTKTTNHRVFNIHATFASFYSRTTGDVSTWQN